jgi:hypothetical protein
MAVSFIGGGNRSTLRKPLTYGINPGYNCLNLVKSSTQIWSSMCFLVNKPALSASAADILSPVSINSIALDLPISLVNLCVPPAPVKLMF